MLDEYVNLVNTYAATQLDPYVGRLQERYEHRAPTGKEINDPIWGTIQLSAYEVLLVDSPLMQRLRRIKQLGVVHLVYPGATHSRLEHCIGTHHVVCRLLAAIDESLTGQSHGPINEAYAQVVRIAALCHDVGHGVMSHVSENALAYRKESTEIHDEFLERYGSDSHIGEINSYLLTGSPAFSLLLSTIAALTHEGPGLPAAEIPPLIQKCVIGLPILPEVPQLHQLVSGPFDADKLDYMTRDAFMSGVPQVTDVNRLVQKVRAVQLPRGDVPRAIQELTTSTTSVLTVFGIARSGNRTLDEISLARALLFDKLYRHQKTRASESMVAALFSIICEGADVVGVPLNGFFSVLVATDDDLWSANLDALCFGFTLTSELRDKAHAIISKLCERELFVRALSFSRKMTGDPFDYEVEQGEGLVTLLGGTDDAINRRNLAAEIGSRTEDVLRALGKLDLLDPYGGSTRDLVWIDGVSSAGRASVTADAMLVGSDDTLIPFEDDAPETQQWVAAYQQTRDDAFVFCPEDIAPEVALAAESILRTKFGVRLPAASLYGGRMSSSSLSRERRTLSDAGFYSQDEADLKPAPRIFENGATPSVIAEIAGRLFGYTPPLMEIGSAGHDTFHPERVKAFLRQFETDDDIRNAMELLRSVRMIGRTEIVDSVREFLLSNEGLSNGSLVVLGIPGKDSSAIATYYALDAASTYPGLKVRSLADALLVGDPILFVDDIVGSGQQAASIITALFGDFELSQMLGETREELPGDLQNLLASRAVNFLFAGGFSEGTEYLREHTSSLLSGLGEVHVLLRDDALPTIHNSGDLDVHSRDLIISRFKDIGRELLRDADPEKIEQRLLGYGNKGLLVTFPYNTPAQTLTCLWMSGELANGQKWTPLFPRRSKF